MENKVKITVAPNLSEFKVLNISGKKGDVLTKHQVNQNALLLVRNGKIIYSEQEMQQQLSAGECKDIPAKVIHEVACLEDSDFFVVLSNSTKMKFEK